MNRKPVQLNYNDFKKILLADPQVRQEYETLGEEFELISELIRVRKQAGKSQNDLAAAMHTSSSVISRLESISGQKKHSPTLATLKKYAQAVGCRLSIKFIPKTDCHLAAK